MPDHVLCYVKDHWAYFTSLPLADQDGEEWDRKSYEHQAGEPDNDQPGQIVKVAWDGEFEDPAYWADGYGSWLSVLDINAGACVWLVPARYGNQPRPDARPIPAGTTLPEFRRLIALGGGKVYESTEDGK